MSSSSAAGIQKTLNELLNEVKNIRKHLEDLNARQAVTEEMANSSMRLLNDLSAKKDLELCSLNLKNATAKTSKQKASPADKKKVNIMAYFKQKYRDCPETLYGIISEKEIADVLKTHEAVLKSKKKKGDAESAEAALLYSELIKTKPALGKLRTMKEQEEENNVVHLEEIVECDVVDEDEEPRENNLVTDDDAEEDDSEED